MILTKTTLEELREMQDIIEIENEQYNDFQKLLENKEDDWDQDYDSMIEYGIKEYEKVMENETK